MVCHTGSRLAFWARTVGVRRLAAVGTLVACLAAAGAARAQMPTVQLQQTYKAFYPFAWPPSARCWESERVYISEPATPGSYPVLVYLHGTLADWYGNQEGQAVIKLAASEGWVAAAFTYDSALTGTLDGAAGNTNCMFNPAVPTNPITQVCALAEADCSHGFVVSGFSQGGAIAGLAKNVNPQVQAAWIMGVSGPATTQTMVPPVGTRALPDDKLRIDVGQRDIQSTNPTTKVTTFNFSGLTGLTGQSCSTFNCLNADGSGYYIVSNAEVADGVADHCYWQSVNKVVPTNSCRANPTFDPGFTPPSTTPWSLLTTLDWLAAQL
ncbi:MAG: hypothetical protein ACXVSJ_02740 [Solirubrobacteraceae bacterium]